MTAPDRIPTTADIKLVRDLSKPRHGYTMTVATIAVAALLSEARVREIIKGEWDGRADRRAA